MNQENLTDSTIEQPSSNSKNKLILICLLTTTLVVLFILGIILFNTISKPNNSSLTAYTTTSKTNTAQSQSTRNLTSSTELKIIEYRGVFVDEAFALSYPDYFLAERIDQNATWDWELTTANQQISIDYSAEFVTDANMLLENWVSLWGSRQVEFTASQLSSGTLSEGYTYHTFSVTEPNDSYTITLVDMGKAYNNRGYLAIKLKGEQPYHLEDILSTIHKI